MRVTGMAYDARGAGGRQTQKQDPAFQPESFTVPCGVRWPTNIVKRIHKATAGRDPVLLAKSQTMRTSVRLFTVDIFASLR